MTRQRGIDVGMQSVAIKQGMFLQEGAGNQSYTVQYWVSQSRCVNGWGAIFPVTSQRIVKKDYETVG